MMLREVNFLMLRDIKLFTMPILRAFCWAILFVVYTLPTIFTLLVDRRTPPLEV